MSVEKTSDMVGLLLRARTVAHAEHWATDSFSRHMALGAFYEGLGELLDKFVESYQGYIDQRVKPPILGGPLNRDIVAELEEHLERLELLRYQAVPKQETCLQNIIDEIEGLHQVTLYKLKMLK